MNNIPMIDKKILYICKEEYDYFLSKKHVFGVGLGYKVTKEFCTFKKCIKVFVSTKLSINLLNSQDIIPDFYKGIPTDIVQKKRFKASALTTKIRPTLCGYSIGPTLFPVCGTLGCIVQDDSGYYILGSSHALSYENTLKPGANILQPALSDGGAYTSDKIGTLLRYIPIRFRSSTKTPKNYVDCALCKIINENEVSSKIALIGNLKGTSSLILGETIKKVGRSTELTFGTITELGITTMMELRTGTALFLDLIGTTKMSAQGDSGSILVDTVNNASGMLLGSCDDESLFMPIITILNSLKVNLVLND